MKRAFLWGGVGALGMYFFDPQMGRTRRAKISDQLGAVARRSAEETSRKAEYMKGQAEGLKHMGTPERPPENDPALKSKVESEVLTRWDYPKGDIVVNVVGGVVELRGVAETTEQINDIEQEVRKVTGVVDVHNYLHLPDTPAPNKQR